MKKYLNYFLIFALVPVLVLSSCKKTEEEEPENKAPIANAGVDQTVQMETEVTLDGTASSDPEAATITYLWSEPDGIALSSVTDAQPTFTAPVVTDDTDFVFTLTVSDGSLSSAPDEVTITVSAEEVTAGYPILKNYMVANSLDLTDVLVDWVFPANAVVDLATYTIPDWYVMDIRSAEDYTDGHIIGAHNVALANVLTEAANAGGLPILVVCKTGQTAGNAVMALRLSGYADAAVLKFGMAGWNPYFEGAWENSIGNTADDNATEWSTDSSPALESFAAPSWGTTATEGSVVLAERVQLMLDNGFQKIASDDIWGNQDNFQIHNFWAVEDYTNFGHFSTAYQLKPISLGGDEVSAIDPASTTLVYCFTGQTSSMATAWLNVLGYETKSILFGANRLKYDELEAAEKPHWHGPENYNYE